MRLQDSQANCGPLALRNGLAAMGISRSTEELEKLCRTDAVKGTGYLNLVKAIGSIEGCNPRRIDETRADIALLLLDAGIRAGRAVIILVQNWSHYVSVIGHLGNQTLVADSADAELVVSWDAETLKKNWECAGARRPYWGVIL